MHILVGTTCVPEGITDTFSGPGRAAVAATAGRHRAGTPARTVRVS
jgi:hypothetical protein